jgi:hypothetical protein
VIGRAVIVVALVGWLVGALACVSDFVPRPGEERARCRQEGRCDPRLECWSDRCVRPPPADCRPVAERLSSVRLGNYAPREAREPAIREIVALCERAQLSRKEGRCLLEAGTDDELAACPFPLLPELAGDQEGCRALGDHAVQLLRKGAPDDLEMAMLLGVASRVSTVIAEQCVTRRWNAAASRCLRDVTEVDAVEACIDQLDQDDRRALDDAMEALLDDARRGGKGGGGGDPWE